MNCFTNSSSGLADRSELKAVLLALVSCLLFLGLLAVVFRSDRTDRQASNHRKFAPPPVPRPFEVPVAVPPADLPPLPDGNQEFRAVPPSFRNIDFNNRSYGTYSFPDGRHVELELVGRQFRLFIEIKHFFELRDVFYADVTGDLKPEAIVRLSHLRCSYTCDGPADLFYIYTLERGVLKEIFQYETGNIDSGCGLKTFATRKQQLMVEMFGECPKFADIPKASKSVLVDRLTRIEFRYDGERFFQFRKRTFPIESGSSVGYATEIRIADEYTQAHGGGGTALD